MSTKEYGCFFCNGKSSQYDGSCNLCGKPIDITTELLALTIDGYTVENVIGRGFYGWTLKVRDNYQSFALKLIPKHRLRGGPLEDREARALADCSPHRNIARFWRQLVANVAVRGQSVEIVGLLFDFIENARPLSKIIAASDVALTRGDVVAILTGIASGLARLHARERWHDDLHDDNVLVRVVEADENLPERYEAKLVDFGSVTPRRDDQPEHGDRSDYEYVAKHILQLVLHYETHHQSTLVAADRTFAARLRRLAQRVSDKHTSRRNLTPTSIAAEIRSALEECTSGHDFPSFEEMLSQSEVSFSDPLANTNALNLSPQDVARLFRDSFNWMARLQKCEPVVIVGPRGCGKTMLLRYLSIASQARPMPQETSREQVATRLRRTPYVGFLISVGQIRTPFIRSAYKKLEAADKAVAEEYCREYINAQFVFEVCRSIAWLCAEKLADIRQEEIAPLASVISALHGDDAAGVVPIADLQTLAEALDKRVMWLSSISDPRDYRPSSLARDDVLQRISEALKASSWAREKEVLFLLDDYSVTILSPFVQSSYNPVLFRLSRDVRIKVTSEGSHPIREDTLGRKYKEGRELSFVNLGEVYFQSDEAEGQRFFEEILDARFTETGKGSLEELKTMLGTHPHEKKFSEYILSRKRPGNARFHGFRLLCCLCSGDVSFILELLHTMTQGRWGEGRLIPAQEQDAIIKRFAQRQLADLRTISEHGSYLYEFAERLGNLLKQYLLQSRNKPQPDERLRIEIEGDGELTPQAQAMEDILFRHSVLIHGGAGKSRRGLPTQRLFFRRLFAPCFPFTPSRNGCIPLTVQEYERWLLDPKKVWSMPPQQTDIEFACHDLS